MSAAIYPTEAIYLGDAWLGIPATTVTINGAPPADALATVEIIFFKAEDGPETPALTLTSADEDVTLTSAANWEFTVPASVLDLGRGEWSFRVALISTAGEASRRTYLVGTQEIL